jgi:hypothetical protein
MIPPASERAALVIGHPGHELRILGWLRARKPLVLILTDGAGHGEEARTDLSQAIIANAGARCGDIFGQVPDQQVYSAILKQDAALFLALSESIADSLIEAEIDWVAGDAIEGYNPTHDLCRWVIDRALRRVKDRTGRAIANFQFPLVAHPAVWASRSGAVCHALTEAELREKVAIVRGYAQTVGGILVAEVESAIAAFGEPVFAKEWFSPAAASTDSVLFETEPPFYEKHGEERVATGHYHQVIRYKEHIATIVRALQS